MKTAKKVCESDDQGVVHVDVPVGRSGQRVEVLVVWDDAPERDEVNAVPADPSARRARLEQYATWTEEQLHEFEAALSTQRVVDSKLWS